MGRGGGLVFTGMPRRREVLGTGIIRWEKVINPDGSVTWQEAQPTTASGSSKKEEKSPKAEKQKLERPSWIETKKESTNHTKRPAKNEAAEDLAAAQKEPKVEEVRPRRAFSFHQAEEKKVERTEKATHVEEVRFGAPIRKDDEKKGGFVAGLATKFGSSTRKAEDVSTPKKDVHVVEIQPSTSTHHTLHVPTEEKQYTPPPPLSPPKEEKPPIADDYFSHSHWSIRDDSKQESDAELAQRLANTEKIFRQQEQKIQAALDRIRDLERQLASGFTTTTTTSPEQEADQTETKTWDNESIAAGGRESGPHFRQLHAHAGNSSKGPLPCFSGDDEPPFHYRVLTVNSNKPRVTNNNNAVREQLHRHYYESISSADVIINTSDDDSRTPSPIAVSFNLPVPAAPAAPPKTHPIANLTPITSSPKSFVLQSLQSTPATTTTTTTRTAKKHKPLPLLPTTDARAIRPGLRSSTTPSPTTPTKPSFCIPPPNSSSTRPRPTYHRSVSNFKKGQKTRPLTPIPEEPCLLKRRPRVPRMRRRSISRSISMSMTGDCGVATGSGSGRPGSGSGRGQCGAGGEGGRRGALDRVRTN